MKRIGAEVEAIIFDLGRVIIDVDFDRTLEAFNDMTGWEHRDLVEYARRTPVFQNFELGRIGVDEFRKGVRELVDVPLTDMQIDSAWNAMLGEVPERKLRLLEGLKSRYRTFALSNTNAMHIGWVDLFIMDRFQVEGLEPFFEKAYYSHEIGLRKPDPSAYLHLLNEENLAPGSTLFLDDLQENIDSASSLGLQTIRIDHPDQVYELFPALV